MGEAMVVGVDYLEPPTARLSGVTCSAPRGTCRGREWVGVSRGQKTHFSHRAGRAGLGGVTACSFLPLMSGREFSKKTTPVWSS